MDNVERLARLARACGLDGVVCSAQEAPVRAQGDGQRLRARHARASASPATARDDQARVVTPVDAVRIGADYLVIGRSITGARGSRRAMLDADPRFPRRGAHA